MYLQASKAVVIQTCVAPEKIVMLAKLIMKL
jgi:hypothetical protein